MSALLLIYVTFQIEKSQRDVAWTYSGSGLSLLQFNTQNSTNALRLAEALFNYRINTDESKREELRAAYLQEFDIVWSATVYLKQFNSITEYPDLVKFRNASKETLESLDPLMQPDIVLTEDQLNEVSNSITALSRLNSNVAAAHLKRIANRSVELNAAIVRLQTLAHLLVLVFLVSLAITGYVIWRMLRQERAQAEELKLAHVQQEVLVNELRSGEAEKRAKSQFLAAVSHDLRQPLHAMGLFLSSLEKSVTGEDGHKILAKIRSSTSALNGLFNGMLDISRLDAGVVEVEKTRVSLKKLFRLLSEEYRDAAIKQDVTLTIESTDLYVYSDQLLLTRILRNLLENALLHAPSSHVTVDVRTRDTKDDELITGKAHSEQGDQPDSTLDTGEQNIEIRVSDTGPGIPEKLREVVFSEYYQLNNPERDRNKGLGLGLSIVKRLSNLMGHDLTLSSNEHGGSVFTIRMPKSEATPKSEITYASPDNSAVSELLRGLNVVVIDDEKDIREGMAVTLDNVGCRVHTCESGDEARDLLVSENLVPDLIIADYRLRKGKTGSQAVEQLREELNQDVPALLITGDTSAIRVREAQASGIRLLHKPVLPAELLRVMTEVVVHLSRFSPILSGKL